jgi:hypothetical protein
VGERAALLTLLQVVGAGLLLAGLYLLAGLAWTLVVTGAALLAVSTLAELSGPATIRRSSASPSASVER